MAHSKPNRVALITGSGRERVGNVVARHLAEVGYGIALHYHSSEDEAHQTRDELRDAGADCEAYQADVSNDAQVKAMVAAVHDRFGRLDGLVTTSSIWSSTPLEEVTSDDLQKNFAVNTLGTFFTARAAGRVMVDQPDGGAIVTFGDWAIDRPYPDHAAYFISKGAIPTLTRVLARELGHRNPQVRVNCIHPGPVMFPPNMDEREQRELRKATLVDNANCPQTVATAVEFLLDNRFITGACLPVDGGRHMYSPGEE